MKQHIPNTLTCCNLLCGSAATYLATQNLFAWAFLFIILAAVFDFLDGFVARLLNVSSPIGKELDSLADDITFGLAPAMMLFCFLKTATPLGWWSLLAFLMAAFSALRLAKFNLDTRQTSSFIGLATPANAVFWASLVSFLAADSKTVTFDFAESITCVQPHYSLYMGIALLLISLIACYLLVAEIPFFSLKFHNFTWKDNKVRFALLIGGAVIVVVMLVLALLLQWYYILAVGVLVVIWYFVLMIVDNCSGK